jgi:peptidoglycan/xylan/chitin deacetylase (PgdA/CDA1 family)
LLKIFHKHKTGLITTKESNQIQMTSLFNQLFMPILNSQPISALANRHYGCGIPIFMVHRIKTEGQSITGISQEHLRSCLRYLVENDYNFLSLEAIIQSLKNREPLPEKAVAFTMDDGYLDQARFASPIFLEFNCPVTFFVITGMIDQKLWPWDAQIAWVIENSKNPVIEMNLSDEVIHMDIDNALKKRHARRKIRDFIKEMDAELSYDSVCQLASAAGTPVPESAPADYQALNWEMARDLEKKGIRFAPHSRTHRILSKLGRDAVESEIRSSWESMASNLIRPLKVFCYPTGRKLDFGPREIDILKHEGFLGATSTIPGYVTNSAILEEQLFYLPRFELPESMNSFKQYCGWIEYAKWKTRN